MNIIVCCKLAAEVKDIEIKADGSISYDKAEWIISPNDLQAVEAAVSLIERIGGKIVVLSAVPDLSNKIFPKKDLLSRGPDELYLIEDAVMETADTNLTARVLAAAINIIGNFDLIICGEGSSNLNFQQVGMQLGELLGIPTINSISRIETDNRNITAERSLEDEIEVLDISLPALIAVTADMNQPRLPTIRETLKAMKKPMVKWSLKDLELSGDVEPRINILRTCSTQQTNIKQAINFPILLMLEMIRSSQLAKRKQIIISGNIEESTQALVDYLDNEGII